MNYSQEYQRGPLHVGKVDMNYRAYIWSDEQIEKYKKLKSREDFKLLGVIDSSVKAAMESLGEELERYLGEAGEDFESKQKDDIKVAKESGKPHSSTFISLKEMVGKAAEKKKKKHDDWHRQIEEAEVTKKLMESMWGLYHHFKKHHDMLNW